MKNVKNNNIISASERPHYGSLDALRTIAVIGIVMMHVISHQTITSGCYLTNSIIPDFTNFTYMFMTLSAFSMCCGYYQKVKEGKIDLDRFYKRRFTRIFPFFGLMVLIELIKDHNMESLYESFANLTLCFGLYPNADINVIGVGWFLGLVFVFYMLFPFFVFLLSTKRRAWLSFAVAIALYAIGVLHFAADQSMPFERKNILFSASFFIVGGIIYLYRDNITCWIKQHIWLSRAIVIVATVLHYSTLQLQGTSIFPHLALFAVWILFCIGSESKLLCNKFMKFISNLSLEIYLCHMMFYRAVEMVHLDKLIHNEACLYCISVVLTFALATAFSYFIKEIVFKKIKTQKS
ncbi:MAG: acyltransferase [Muribaculaceae bacterium]|nr:acyltransferase [Muribaculaceae bacterium]